MHRREFLHPRRIAHTTGQVLGALELHNLSPPEPSPSEPIALLRFAHRAMAAAFEVFLPFGTTEATSRVAEAFTLLDALEDQLTVYRETSEVCRLNRLAPTQAVPIETGLFDLLTEAAHLTEETQGAFDVSAGALVKAWGFFRGPPRIPPEEERQGLLQRVGMGHVERLADSQSVRYLRPGLEINLGSIGKGYALDRMAGLLFDEGKIPTGLLHGGQSSVYARGSPTGDGQGWQVGIAHPSKPRRAACVWLQDRALGTSAATYRHLEHQGRRLGHVLDPRTGWPAEGLGSATVLAPTATRADALATAFFILGEEGTRAYCKTHPEVGAILLPARPDAPPMMFNVSEEEVLL